MHSPMITQEYGPPSAAGELVSDRPRVCRRNTPEISGIGIAVAIFRLLGGAGGQAAEHHGLSEPPLSTLTHDDLGLVSDDGQRHQAR